MANEITKGDRTARLELKAMRLLACLAGRAERPVTREALSAAIWPVRKGALVERLARHGGSRLCVLRRVVVGACDCSSPLRPEA